jgi:hypothetical protein
MIAGTGFRMLRAAAFGAALAAALPLSPGAAAQQAETYGDWMVQGPADGAITASTATPAGSLFGMVCDRLRCDAFFNPKIACDDGHDYPALIGSRTATFAATMRCTTIGDFRAFVLPLGGGLADAMAAGGELGIAFPLDAGQFGETRFSLTGAAQAAARARERVGLSRKPAA